MHVIAAVLNVLDVAAACGLPRLQVDVVKHILSSCMTSYEKSMRFLHMTVML